MENNWLNLIHLLKMNKLLLKEKEVYNKILAEMNDEIIKKEKQEIFRSNLRETIRRKCEHKSEEQRTYSK